MVPIVCELKKKTNIAATTQPADVLLDISTMNYFTKSKSKLRSPDAQFFLNLKASQRVPLLVQKSNAEGRSCYYLGEVCPDPSTFTKQLMKDKETPVMRMKLLLDRPIEDGIFEYITN